MTMNIFWSWQSDSPGKNNHFFVRDALVLALKQVADDLDLTEAERPEVDHDTKGEPGLVSIVDKIFEKISQAAVFVGDLTYVGKTEKGKLLPNPNVMIELGHAITSLGPERIILVSNRAYGGRPEDLPFDLRHRRAPISYDLPDTASGEDRKKVQRELVGALVSALAGCLGRVLEQAAKTVEYPAAPVRSDDRSTWLMTDESIQHHGFFHEGQDIWTVLEEPRFYLRVIPAKYEGNMRPRDIHDLPQQYRLSVLSPWVNGNGGVNSLGVVSVGLLKNQMAHAATQWFKKTSEVWAFNCNATFIHDGQRLLAWGNIPRSWLEHLDRTLAFLNHIGVRGPLQVEAGGTGLKDSVWSSNFGRCSTSLEDEVHLQCVDAKWESQTRAQFLTDAFNLLGEAYNQPSISVEEFLKIQ